MLCAQISPAAGGRFSAGRARACAAVGPRRHGGARGGAARGAAAPGHPRRHLLGGSGQRHRAAPGAGAAGGGGRGRRRVPVLVLLRAGGEPPAVVLGTPPQVVPRCRLLPGRAEAAHRGQRQSRARAGGGGRPPGDAHRQSPRRGPQLRAARRSAPPGHGRRQRRAQSVGPAQGRRCAGGPAARGVHQRHGRGRGWEDPADRQVLRAATARAVCARRRPQSPVPQRRSVPCSGDGTMGVFNIKRRRFELLSEPQSGDLTSVVLLKRGKKVACGSSEGTIYLFNWNGFGATSDRFSLRAESVDCMVPITESIVCTGSLDGVIRAVNILPNRVLGCVGQHLGEPIEQLAVAPGGQLLASCAHDQKVKFWDISSLGSMVVDEYRKKKKRGGPLKALSSKAAGSGEDFFADLREEQEATAEAATGSDSDDSD